MVAALLFLSACGSTITVEADPNTDPQLAAVGEGLYQQHCAACHGTDLRGTDRGPSHLSAVYAPGHHADGAFTLAVTRGAPQHHWNFGPMPPIDGLSDAEIKAITAYVRVRQAEEGLEPYPP